MRKLLYIFCMACVVIGCARMGHPDGGWYDDDPPVVIGSHPADQSTNVSAKKITIYFNEYIKLEDATNKVIVSPPQLEVPEIKEAGKLGGQHKVPCLSNSRDIIKQLLKLNQ